jgi:hypothetical protein
MWHVTVLSNSGVDFCIGIPIAYAAVGKDRFFDIRGEREAFKTVRRQAGRSPYKRTAGLRSPSEATRRLFDSAQGRQGSPNIKSAKQSQFFELLEDLD